MKFDPFPEFAKNNIYEGKLWTVQLHSNQSYLGRCVVFLSSRSIEDPLLLTKEERNELWDNILPRLAQALRRAFQPDRVNYAHLANEEHVVHWHIVPRYEKNRERQFAGELFRDERAGTVFIPAPEKKVSGETMENIRQIILQHF